MSKTYTVYIHILPKSISRYEYDKYYVGITSNPVNIRWSNGKGYQENQPRIHNAIQKYGWDAFEHYIVAEHLTESDAKNFEIALIRELNAFDGIHGYNISHGGDTCDHLGTMVAQYDLSGNFVDVYKSLREAARKNGWNILSMCQCLSSLSLHGYMWRRVDNPDNIAKQIDPYDPKCNWNYKTVRRYELDGTFIDEIRCKDAYEIYGATVRTAVYKYNQAYGYQWRFSDDDTPVKDIRNEVGHNPVFVYTEDGKFIKKCESHKDALREFTPDQSDSKIPKRIFNNIYDNLYRGFRFTKQYYEQLPPLIHISCHCRPFALVDIDNSVIHEIYTTQNEACEINDITPITCNRILKNSEPDGLDLLYLDQMDLDTYSFYDGNIKEYCEILIKAIENRDIANQKRKGKKLNTA